MKFDVITVAVAVLMLGALASSLDLGEAFAGEEARPTALQQGALIK